jgi:protein-S-isoprenylcysteine O-methyltransferase Ste14
MALRLENRVPPPLVGAGVAALMYGAAWLSPALDFPLPGKTWIAVAIAGIGLGIDIAGAVQFWRARTTINPLSPQKASALVTGGIYRWTRNPMYLGMAALLLAWGLHLANVAALAVILLFVTYLTRFQIRPEERALEARFGSEFAAYCERVRRWL